MGNLRHLTVGLNRMIKSVGIGNQIIEQKAVKHCYLNTNKKITFSNLGIYPTYFYSRVDFGRMCTWSFNCIRTINININKILRK